MSLGSIYDDGLNTDFLKRVEVACVRLSRTILETELHTDPHHAERAGLATRILAAPQDPSLFRQFALLVDPGDAVDQSIATSDSALIDALSAVWTVMAGGQ